MGTPKGLLPFDGKPWVMEQLNRYTASGGQDTCLVLGSHAHLYQAEVPELKSTTQILINHSPEIGSFHSVQIACRYWLKKGAQATLLLPIDVPLVPYHLTLGRNTVIQPSYEKKRGHPVILSAKFMTHLAALPPSSRLDQEIKRLSAAHRAQVPINNPDVLLNLNTPQDWDDYCNRCNNDPTQLSR